MCGHFDIAHVVANGAMGNRDAESDQADACMNQAVERIRLVTSAPLLIALLSEQELAKASHLPAMAMARASALPQSCPRARVQREWPSIGEGSKLLRCDARGGQAS